jgi:hypothetical protein
MSRWLPVLLYAVFFYLMMRFGCGGHRAHRNHDGKEKHKC